MDIGFLRHKQPQKYRAIMNYIEKANKTGWQAALLVFDDDTAIYLYFSNSWRATYYEDIVKVKL